MNLNNINNGTFIWEEDVFKTIEECILNHTPIMVFVNMTSVQFTCKLISVVSQIKKDFDDLTSEEYDTLDRKINEICQAPLWLNDMIIKSIEDYKSAEEVIANEKIKYVFIDSLPEAIDKTEIIKWSEEVGFNVYFTKLTKE